MSCTRMTTLPFLHLASSLFLIFVILEKAFWYLLLILLNDFRNFFTFYINLDIDEVLLLDQNQGQEIIPLELLPFVILGKNFSFCF